MRVFFDKNFWLSFLQPYLISIYPAIMVASGNLGQFYFGEIALYSIFLFFFVLLFYSLLGLLYKDWNKASLFLSVLILFFYFFHVIANKYFIPIAIFTQKHFFKFQVRYFFIIILLLVGYLFFKLFKIKRVHNAFSRSLIIPLIVIYVFNFSNIFVFYNDLRALTNKWDENQVSRLSTELAIKDVPLGDTPDIYYIILDTYTSKRALKVFRDFDIKWFFDELENKGFYISHGSTANYGCTEISLSSSLNMEYHESFKRKFFYAFLRHKIRNNIVKKFLQKLGYKYVYIGYDIPFKIECDRDLTIFKKICNYITLSFYDMTRPFGFLPCVLGGWSLWYYYWTKLEFLRHYNLILNDLKILKNSISIDSPKFVFAHIECPHGPNVFDKDGNFNRDLEDGYVDQVEFISKRINEVIDLILKRDKRSIIILQGDHGEPITGMFAGGDVERCVDFGYQIRRAFPILNAYYFYDKNKYKNLYDSISPVNSFRALFNALFGTDLKILKDYSFIGHDKDGFLYNIDFFKN